MKIAMSRMLKSNKKGIVFTRIRSPGYNQIITLSKAYSSVMLLPNDNFLGCTILCFNDVDTLLQGVHLATLEVIDGLDL